jgi:agmatinase
MKDLSQHNPNCVSNPNYNLFGLPTSEENARLIVLPVPWEVTVSYGAGTARAPESILKASHHMDIYDEELPDEWKKGFYLMPCDKKILMKSDYLRREAELYIDYISKGDDVKDNQFMTKSLREVNEGGIMLNQWVYEQTRKLLNNNKLVGLLGGDHSTPLGFMKALAEIKGTYGILQIDAHCDLRNTYEGFDYSHAGIMYNALREIDRIEKLVQIGVRDYSQEEFDYISQSQGRVRTYFDKEIRQRQLKGESWYQITQEIIDALPHQVYISFDIDGLERSLCPDTGTPVPGGFQLEELYLLFSGIIHSGRTIIGFDLSEVGVSEHDWNANVAARLLLKLCNLLSSANR